MSKGTYACICHCSHLRFKEIKFTKNTCKQIDWLSELLAKFYYLSENIDPRIQQLANSKYRIKNKMNSKVIIALAALAIVQVAALPNLSSCSSTTISGRRQLGKSCRSRFDCPRPGHARCNQGLLTVIWDSGGEIREWKTVLCMVPLLRSNGSEV